MRELSNTWTSKEFTFTIINRIDDVALVSKSWRNDLAECNYSRGEINEQVNGQGIGNLVCFEVAHVVKNAAREWPSVNSKPAYVTEACESWPSDEYFGKSAWSYKDSKDAENRLIKELLILEHISNNPITIVERTDSNGVVTKHEVKTTRLHVK